MSCHLNEFAEELKNPVFVCYFGRKSGSPAYRIRAVTVEAASILEAFRLDGWKPAVVVEGVTLPEEAAMYWDADGTAGVSPRHIYQRRDEVLSRKRWAFSNRSEYFEMVTMSGLEVL